MMGRSFLLALVIVPINIAGLSAQPYGQPDRSQPGDAAIQAYLAEKSRQIDALIAGDVTSLAAWEKNRPAYREQYFEMLGLWPLPERTPLKATVTGEVHGDGYVVENLHYQSVPQLYVTANVYRPAKSAPRERHPAILYVCGHSGRGRNGNKTAFQSHGIWFARHGYVCLVVDTLQLGEIAAIHHGTYNRERWWWHSRGYTSAGVECWNGVRGIDYLVARPDVDPERIGVTGISGGGAATFWVAAADERVRVAVPVSGMADLESYVGNRVINGHCDCMFLHNGHAWPWTRIAALVAPRPMLFVNSDNDAIFPMDANDRVIQRLERLYSLYGASDRVDAVVSVGGHDYRADIRQAVYRCFQSHLKGDARPITDSEVDLVEKDSHPIDPVKLRAFPTDADLPKDERNTTIDEHFVPLGDPGLPQSGQYAAWRTRLLRELRRYAWRSLPAEVPAAKVVDGSNGTDLRLETEPGVQVSIQMVQRPTHGNRMLVVIDSSPDEAVGSLDWLVPHRQPSDGVVVVRPRGASSSRWTRKNPPNYIERSHVLLGETVDVGRLRDLLAAVALGRTRHADNPLWLAGRGPDAIRAVYAAIGDEKIAGVIAVDTPPSHLNNAAPQFLGILRTADVPHLFGLVAPRPLALTTKDDTVKSTTRAIFKAAGAEEQLTLSRD